MGLPPLTGHCFGQGSSELPRLWSPPDAPPGRLASPDIGVSEVYRERVRGMGLYALAPAAGAVEARPEGARSSVS
jgi:hypothetical protein